ncbi:MAG: hypothetical protein ACXAEU_05595 [Candidatus Hodarchaeales archaeon]|jgi:transposase InsO family protein
MVSKSNRLREPKPSKVSFRTDTFSTKRRRTDVYSEKLGKEMIIYADEENQLTIKKGESLLEMRLHVLLEHELAVLSYDYQSTPPDQHGESIPLVYTTEKDTIQEWIPDVYAIWKDLPPWVIEVKPLASINKAYRFFENKFTQSWDFCKDRNWFFYVFTDAHVTKSFRVDNLIDLKSQIGCHTEECCEAIKKEISVRKTTTTRILIEKLSISPFNYPKNVILSSVFTLIYYNHFYIDLDEDFTIDSDITNDHTKYVPLDKWLIQYDWKSNIEKRRKEGLLEIIDENVLGENQQEKLKRNQNIVDDWDKGISVVKLSKKYSLTRQAIYDVINKFDSRNTDESLLRKKGSGRKKQELFLINSNGKITFTDHHFGDVVKNVFLTDEESTITGCYKAYLSRIRFALYEKGLITKRNASIKELKAVIGNKFITKHVFTAELERYTLVKKGKVIASRKGIKEAIKQRRNVTSTTPFANYIGQMCQIDHTPADIIGIPYTMFTNIKLGKTSTKHMERATITVIIDVYTRVIVGYSIRYRKPSKETDFLAIRRMVLGNVNPSLNEDEQKQLSSIEKIIKGLKSLIIPDERNVSLLSIKNYEAILEEIDPPDGSDGLRQVADWWDKIRVMPRMIHVDNGSDFISDDVEKWAHENNVTKAVRPVGGSQYGGMVERVLQTLNRDAFHDVPGTTKGNIKRRGDYKSEKKAILTFEQLEALFLLATLRYHVRVHRSLTIPPAEKWYRAVERGDNLSKNLTEDEIKKFAFNSMPREERTYSDNKGVSINDIYYNYNADTNLYPNDKSWAELYIGISRDKRKIEVRTDTSDIRYVWWFNPNIGKRGLPVKVWANYVAVSDRSYGSEKLKRMKPISLHQLDDLKRQYKYERGFDIFEYYERLENSFDNIMAIIKEAVPRTPKERKRYLERQREINRISGEELRETEAVLTGKLPSENKKLLSKPLLTKKSKDVEMEYYSTESEPEIDTIIDIEIREDETVEEEIILLESFDSIKISAQKEKKKKKKEDDENYELPDPDIIPTSRQRP